MKDRNVTIYDVARALDISVSTVSRALNNQSNVKKATKDLVKKKAQELGYQPNFLAQNLRNKKSNTIGIIVPEIVHSFFSRVIDGVEDVAYKAGYKVLISKSNENYLREIENTQSLISCQVDGILASLSSATKDISHFQNIQNHNIPLVLFDRVSQKLETSKVIINDRESAFRAIEHFYEQGYKKIAYVGGYNHLEISKNRLKGFIEGIKKFRLPLIHDFIFQDEMTKEKGYQIAKKLFTSANAPDAILAVSNPIMAGIIEAVQQVDPCLFGKKGLMGYASDPDSYPINVPICTIVQPAFEMGQEATKLLIEEIESTEAVVTKKMVLDTYMVSTLATQNRIDSL